MDQLFCSEMRFRALGRPRDAGPLRSARTSWRHSLACAREKSDVLARSPEDLPREQQRGERSTRL